MPTAQGLRPQVSRFLLIQLGGAFLGVTFWLMLQLPAWTALLVAAMSCTLAAWRWHDGRWWLLIHALFLPLALGFSLLNIDPLWYLLAFGVSWLVFGHVGVVSENGKNRTLSMRGGWYPAL